MNPPEFCPICRQDVRCDWNGMCKECYRDSLQNGEPPFMPLVAWAILSMFEAILCIIVGLGIGASAGSVAIVFAVCVVITGIILIGKKRGVKS